MWGQAKKAQVCACRACKAGGKVTIITIRASHWEAGQGIQAYHCPGCLSALFPEAGDRATATIFHSSPERGNTGKQLTLPAQPLPTTQLESMPHIGIAFTVFQRHNAMPVICHYQ